MTTKEPKDKKACTQQYHKYLKTIQPKYPYHFRLWTSNDLYHIADDWYERDKSLEQIITKKYPTYVKGESFLRDLGTARNASLTEVKSSIRTIFTKYQKMTTDWADEGDLLFDTGFDTFFSQVLGRTVTPLNKLIFAYVLNLDCLGDITEDDFVDGFAVYGCHKDTAMKQLFDGAVKNLTDTSLYAKDFYTGIFGHVSEGATRDRVHVKSAIQYWGVLQPELFPEYKTFPDWVAWLKKLTSTQPSDLPIAMNERTKSWLKRPVPGSNDPVEITKDLWLNWYDFALKMKDDYVKNYDFDGGDAWNTAFDQFVFDFLDLEYVGGEEN